MRRIFFSVVVGLCVLGIAPQSWADRPLVAPINTMPDGQTYGRWAAEWFQWAFGVPAATNPILDTTGEFCDQRQVGNVWFLAGSFSPDPVVRTCTVPHGVSLFFPLINNFYGAFLNEPDEIRTEEFVRGQAQCQVPVTSLSAVVDGFAIPRLWQFSTAEGRSQSPLFNLQFPPGNIFTDDQSIVPELLLSPSAEQGYYIFLRPLSRGEHVIQFSATGCGEGFSQNITYYLMVE